MLTTVDIVLGPRPPFRLDLTVAALRRLPSNPVERWTGDGRYLRAFETARGPVAWEITQPTPARLRLHLRGAAGEPASWRALAGRLLGLDVDLTGFYRAAAVHPAVAALARRFRGVKPPRFASLWEALVSSVVFQQLSLASAMATVARLVARVSPVIELGDEPLRPFPSPAAVANASEAELRALGLSGAKARALRLLAAACASGALDEAELEALPSPAAAERLVRLPGIGPWTASLVLLRGLGRLDVFPAGDAGARRGLGALLPLSEAPAVLERLGRYRGMLYFHLLLASKATSVVTATVMDDARDQGGHVHGDGDGQGHGRRRARRRRRGRVT